MTNDIGIIQQHTQPDDRIVVYLSTRNLYDTLPAAYNSLLAHNPNVRVFLLIEDDTLPFVLPSNITCVNVSGQKLFSQNGPNYNSRYTYMALLKSAMHRIFPDTHKLLILDVDTIVHDDLSPLWDYDLTYSYYAAVTEPHLSKNLGYAYPNFGVVMLNLNMLRTTGTGDDIIAELNKHYHQYPEQDTFASMCGNRMTVLPPDYNVTKTNITGTPHRTIITHFAGINKWNDFDLVRDWTLASAPSPLYVCYMGNPNYYDLIVTASKSLLAHSPVDQIFFLTEHDSFPQYLPSCFQNINVRDQDIFPPSCPNIHPHYTYMTLMRAALSKILPSYVERVLLLDPDTVVMDDISNIWNYDISNHYFAAVQETRNHNHTRLPYYNAGVMLMNLQKLRDDGMDDRIITEINTTHYEHIEQDVLNFLCTPHILDLPPSYNASFVSDPCNNPKIMHFLSFAKKFLPEASEPYASLSWKELQFSPDFTGKEF